MSEITIVGGGISGLVAAFRLAADHRVTVLESGSRLGGCLQQSTLSGAIPIGLDTGAEASLFRRPEAKELAAELGLDVEFPSAEHSSQVFTGGRLHPIPKRTVMGVPAEAAEVAELIGPDAAKRLAHEVITEPIEGADTSLGDFLSERLGPDLVDTLVDPLLGGVYAGRCRELSLAATVPALLPAAREGTSVLDLVSRLLAARDEQATARPTGTGAEPVFMSLVGGINRLIPALADRIRAAGGTIRLDAGVTSVRGESGRWFVETAESTIESDRLVLATPAHVTKDLLAEAAPRSAALLGQVPYATTALVPALIELGSEPFTGSGFLVPPTEDTLIKASTFVSNKWPWLRSHIPAGTALMRMSIGRRGDGPDGWRSLDDADLIEKAFADWQSITGRTGDRLLAAEVQRWDQALPQYLPGHAELIGNIDADIAAIDGLELAGSAFDGVGIPACISRAEAVAARLLAADE